MPEYFAFHSKPSSYSINDHYFYQDKYVEQQSTQGKDIRLFSDVDQLPDIQLLNPFDSYSVSLQSSHTLGLESITTEKLEKVK